MNNKMALRLMIKKIAETVMHEISFNTLAGNVKATGTKTSTDSMIEYIAYAENAYLLFRNKKSFVFCDKNRGIKRLIIVTNEEECKITKYDLTIEVIPVYKFIMETAV